MLIYFNPFVIRVFRRRRLEQRKFILYFRLILSCRITPILFGPSSPRRSITTIGDNNRYFRNCISDLSRVQSPAHPKFPRPSSVIQNFLNGKTLKSNKEVFNNKKRAMLQRLENYLEDDNGSQTIKEIALQSNTEINVYSLCKNFVRVYLKPIEHFCKSNKIIERRTIRTVHCDIRKR